VAVVKPAGGTSDYVHPPRGVAYSKPFNMFDHLDAHQMLELEADGG
jgi:hypothetical protein